jgi:hypothetical protein
MSKAELSTAKSYAKLVSALTVEMNSVLAKHGLKDVEIHSFSFGKKPGLATLADPQMVQGIGVTKRACGWLQTIKSRCARSPRSNDEGAAIRGERRSRRFRKWLMIRSYFGGRPSWRTPKR